MTYIIIIITTITIATAIACYAAARERARKKLKEWDHNIARISCTCQQEKEKDASGQKHDEDTTPTGYTKERDAHQDFFPLNIGEYISHTCKGRYIDLYAQELILKQLDPLYKEAKKIRRETHFCLLHDAPLSKFITEYEHIEALSKNHNDEYLSEQMRENREFFDNVLSYPLDSQQRRAIVSEADNCLVVSSAGSGKTSSIVGKVKYLITKKGVSPERILLISYTNKAAAELTERLNIPGLRGYTFHKLAIDQIGLITKEKPSICDNTDGLFISIFRHLLKSKDFKKAVLEYFIDYRIQEQDWEKKEAQRKQELSQAKKNRYKATLPDMDGNSIYVRSEQEQKLCFILSSLGLRFRYEESYEHPIADASHSQYKPDFSIYYTKDGKTSRAYLEHFGVDEHGQVPLWFAQDKGITYAEANEKYGDGITWKREAHKKFGTLLLETTSADFRYYDIRKKLKASLKAFGIPFEELSDDSLYNMVLPEQSQQEKVFIRMAVTFITLLKNCCKPIQAILSQAKGDKRSLLIISKIIMPIYESYEKELAQRGQKDFTGLILEATTLFKQHHPQSWDYIIVDEFQDISIDRYAFLQALREGERPAKLFCVGDDWQSIYRFSGSDLTLFSQFQDYFGKTDICKIETTFRFGNPLVGQASRFIQRNPIQLHKDVKPFSNSSRTVLQFLEYDRLSYTNSIQEIIAGIPVGKSIFLLGRYSFDDYYLSSSFQSTKRGNKFFYMIGGREIEFLTIHKSKGLEADYVIILQCNKGTFGFPSEVSDDPILNYVLCKEENYPHAEERRLFYVAITRARERTIVLYDKKNPSDFVTEFMRPETPVANTQTPLHRNANKRWGRKGDQYLLQLFHEGKSIKHISQRMGRSQTSIVMRLQKLGAI